MGASKTEHFTEHQNQIAILAKAMGHPARIAILEFLLEGFWTLLDFGNSIREVLNFLKKNLNRNLITNLGCKFSNYFSIAYFYILFYFTKELPV